MKGPLGEVFKVPEDNRKELESLNKYENCIGGDTIPDRIAQLILIITSDQEFKWLHRVGEEPGQELARRDH